MGRVSKQKKIAKAVKHLLEAEDYLDRVADKACDAYVAAEAGSKRKEKLSKVHDRYLALAGMAYELRRLVESQ